MKSFPGGTGRVSTNSQQSAGTAYRPGTSSSRAWDLDSTFRFPGQPERDRALGTDRPHTLKLYGSYFLPFGTEIGAFFLAQSGVPMSTLVQDVNQIPLFVNGRGDLGRAPFRTERTCCSPTSKVR